jgi:hypothetical protein
MLLKCSFWDPDFSRRDGCPDFCLIARPTLRKGNCISEEGTQAFGENVLPEMNENKNASYCSQYCADRSAQSFIMLRIFRQCYLSPESKCVSVYTRPGMSNCLSYVLGSFMLFSKDKYYFLTIFEHLCGNLHFSMHFKCCQHSGRLKFKFPSSLRG